MRDIVLVTVDSLRADHVGWHGYDRETTPNLDQLAEESRVFSSAFAHACSTRPSFPSIQTSSYALMYGGFERLSSERTALAEALSNGGYRTAGFHSNLYLSADFGYDRGFDAFYDSRTDPSVTAKARNYVKRRLDSDGLTYRTLQRLFNATEKRTGIEVGSAYVDATELTDLALEWVRDGSDGGPRFLWIHYMDVHHPYVPPAEHQRRFRDEAVSDRDAIQLRRKMLEAPDDLSERERRTLVDLYDAEIAYVDEEIDRLLDGIDAAWDGDPVVAFTSDHGEEFADHGGFSHAATFYEEVLHVPFLLSDGTAGAGEEAVDGAGTIGGIASAAESDDLVGLLDLAPTLVDCAGLATPDAFEGSSLLDDDWSRTEVIAEWAETGQESADPAAPSAETDAEPAETDTDSGETDAPSPDRRFAIRREDWKYVRMEDGAERLFDLEADPMEQTNIVDDKPDVADGFRGRLREHEELLAATNRDLGEVAMEEDVAERLRMLGYQE